MLKFHDQTKQAKLRKLAAKYKTRVTAFNLLSGWSCPFASDCLSKVYQIGDKRKIKDGPNTEFRCFSASQEAIYPSVYDARKANFDLLRKMGSHLEMVSELIDAYPSNAGICRIHVGGDFFSRDYFAAWILVARHFSDVIFYAYTKSLRYWVGLRKLVDDTPNLVLTASYGGREDHLIELHNLRYARVVFSEKEASDLGLEIDSDDSHACDPHKREQSFALLIHGIQPKGSEAGKAVSALKGKGSYAR